MYKTDDRSRSSFSKVAFKNSLKRCEIFKIMIMFVIILVYLNTPTVAKSRHRYMYVCVYMCIYTYIYIYCRICVENNQTI